MKFEKFLKGVGTHGQILERTNGDKWLVCGGVGMKVPKGVENLLGAGEVPEKIKNLVECLIKADTDDGVQLTKAILETADGKASDIIRVFTGEEFISGEKIEIGICNADFGLLEKADINLSEIEVQDFQGCGHNQFLLVLDNNSDVIGFIQGVAIKRI